MNLLTKIEDTLEAFAFYKKLCNEEIADIDREIKKNHIIKKQQKLWFKDVPRHDELFDGNGLILETEDE